ncbi:MAG TPA: type II secretion system F family protein [Actinomycetota bacterium]|nr:type II secretion system F family protein [Actinomycetota bacterium]
MIIGTTVAAAVFFAGCALAFVTLESVVVERARVNRNLRRLKNIDVKATELRRKELAKPFATRVAWPVLRLVGRFAKRFTPAGVVDRLSKDLTYAGSPAGWDAERILAIKLVASGGGFLVPSLGGPLLGAAPIRGVVAGVLFAILGYYAPEWALRSKAGARQAAIQRALPDALDLLSITVEAGLGFDAAVKRVATQARGPLGDELHRVLQEMQIGKPRAQALRSLADRTSVPELQSFVLAMVQADSFGIAIGQVLHVQAREMRLKRRQRAEERAQKIPVKILMPLLGCVFPSLFVVILGPAAIQIYRSLLS